MKVLKCCILVSACGLMCQLLRADPPCDGSYPISYADDPCSLPPPGLSEYTAQCSDGTRKSDSTLCSKSYKTVSHNPNRFCKSWTQMGPPPLTQCGSKGNTSPCLTRWKCKFVGGQTGCEATQKGEEVHVPIKEDVCPGEAGGGGI